MPTDTLDEDIPYIKGFVKGGEYDTSIYGWVKNANYDVSLYCATECANYAMTTYECGYVTRHFRPQDGHKNVTASAVGCDAGNDEAGRTLDAYYDVANGYFKYAGGFSIGNPSL